MNVFTPPPSGNPVSAPEMDPPPPFKNPGSAPATPTTTTAAATTSSSIVVLLLLILLVGLLVVVPGNQKKPGYATGGSTSKSWPWLKEVYKAPLVKFGVFLYLFRSKVRPSDIGRPRALGGPPTSLLPALVARHASRDPSCTRQDLTPGCYRAYAHGPCMHARCAGHARRARRSIDGSTRLAGRHIVAVSIPIQSEVEPCHSGIRTFAVETWYDRCYVTVEGEWIFDNVMSN